MGLRVVYYDTYGGFIVFNCCDYSAIRTVTNYVESNMVAVTPVTRDKLRLMATDDRTRAPLTPGCAVKILLLMFQ